jgi:hypothetical protein
VGRVDLDAVRAEAETEPHYVTLDGVEYALRPELPPAVIELLVPEDFDIQHPENMSDVPRFSQVARALLMDTTVDAMAFALKMSQDQWEAVFDLYGFSMGESSASAASSSETPAPSRPISPSTTASPSPTSIAAG